MLFTIEPTLLSNLRTVLFLAQHFFISSLDACPPMLRSFHSRLLLFLAGFPFVHDPHHIIKRSQSIGDASGHRGSIPLAVTFASWNSARCTAKSSSSASESLSVARMSANSMSMNFRHAAALT
jgi:hypothetical protein